MMQLKVQMRFGPLDSPSKTIDLIHLVDHLRVVLAAIPFISQAGVVGLAFCVKRPHHLKMACLEKYQVLVHVGFVQAAQLGLGMQMLLGCFRWQMCLLRPARKRRSTP